MIRAFTCQVCEKKFTRELGSSHPGRKYCSRECSWTGRRQYNGSELELNCRKCGEIKPVTEFYPHTTILRGYQYWCIPCTHESRVSRDNIPVDPYTRRRYALWSQYRITPAQYNEMHEQQKGRCAICGILKEPWEPAPHAEHGRFLSVDHDHVTKKVRGLLCSGCNGGLGKFRDNPISLCSAAAYLCYHQTPSGEFE
mgnify:CR=1 FL=1|jgi:hypothetical protein